MLLLCTWNLGSTATIFVGNQGDNTLSVIDAATRTVKATISLSGKKPHNLALSKDGRHLYVANVGSHNFLTGKPLV